MSGRLTPGSLTGHTEISRQRVERIGTCVRPKYPGDVLGWWFYGRDLYLRTDWLVISNNATIAALQAKV
jgi:hypothetical protein